MSGPAITVPVGGDLPARFVIADTHFGQPGLDVVFNRPSNWERLTVKARKEAVGPEDTVIHLGDAVDPGAREDPLPMLADLPGKVMLVPGNWDVESQLTGFRDLGWMVEAGMVICEYRSWIVFFTHEPMDIDELEGYKEGVPTGALNVHGHLHGWPDPSPHHLNVSLEQLDYQPRSSQKYSTLGSAACARRLSDCVRAAIPSPVDAHSATAWRWARGRARDYPCTD